MTSYHNISEDVKSILTQYSGILLQSTYGPAILFDQYGDKFTFLNENDLSALDCDKISHFFFTIQNDSDTYSTQHENTVPSSNELAINLVISDESLYTSTHLELIYKLIGVFQQAKINIRICLSQPSIDWKNVVDFSETIIQKKGEFVPVELEGEIECPSTLTLDNFYEQRFVVRWPIEHHLPNEYDHHVMRVIRELSEFGIPTQIAYYVTAANINRIASNIDYIMPYTHYSGFSLLPYTWNPSKYGIFLKSPSVKYAKKYIELLVDAYKKYPYYDVVFSPVRQIAETTSNGSWNLNYDVYKEIGIRITRQGEIGLFRHNPNRIYGMNNLRKCLDSPDELFKTEMMTPSQTYIGNCTCCDFRKLCGGADYHVSLSGHEWSLECEYRRLFIETFLVQKAIVKRAALFNATKDVAEKDGVVANNSSPL